jgi:hypothetical protein
LVGSVPSLSWLVGWLPRRSFLHHPFRLADPILFLDLAMDILSIKIMSIMIFVVLWGFPGRNCVEEQFLPYDMSPPFE